MGMPTATARRGANGNVEYDVRRPNAPGTQLATFRNMYNKYEDEAKDTALNGLYARETADIQARTSQLGGVSGDRDQATITTNASTASSSEAGNPGMADNQSNGEPDLSTSDTTARRKAGYRRDSGIRI